MKKVSYLLFVSLVLAVFACNQEEENPEPTIEKVTENPNPPEHNSEIVLEKTFGDLSVRNEIIKLRTAEEGNFYIGTEGDKDYFGKIDNFGNVEWKRQLTFIAYDFTLKFNVRRELTEIIIVGGSNNKENSNIIIYDPTGNEIESFTVSEDNYKIQLRGVAYGTSDEPPAIVGMAENKSTGIKYPYYLTFSSFFSSSYDLGTSKVFTEYPNRRFNQITTTLINGGTASAFVVSGNQSTEPNESNKVTIYLFDDDEFSTLYWSTDIVDGNGLKSIIDFKGVVRFIDDYIYIIATTEYSKEPPTSDGTYWQAGLFAKLNLENGNIEWLRSHSFSNKTDFFNGGFLHEGNLYAYGTQSRVFYNYEDGTNSAFGNGILAKINPANGDLISSRTFGDKTNQSNILTGFVNDNKIYLGGFTGYTGGDSGSENWFLVVNL